MNTAELELEMKSALGLQTYKKAKKITTAPKEEWLVILAVRDKVAGAASGTVKRFEHAAACVGEFDAQMQAYRAATLTGHVVWALLDIVKREV